MINRKTKRGHKKTAKTVPRRRRFHVRRGDIVKVISGDDKGKQGRVLKIIADRERVIVEGVAIVKKHVRRSEEYPQGGIIEIESSIHISNVKLIERPVLEESVKQD